MARKRRRSRKKINRRRFKKETLLSIVSLAIFLLAILVTISFLGKGYFLERLNFHLLRYFGLTSFFLPFLLLCYGLWLAPLKTILKSFHISLGASLALLSLGGLLQTGLLGHWLWQQVTFWLTGFGAAIFLFFGFLVGILVLFDTSLEAILLFQWRILKLIRHYLYRPLKKRTPPRLTPPEQLSSPGTPLLREEKQTPAVASEEIPAGPKPVLKVTPAAKEALFSNDLVAQSAIAQHRWQYPPLSLLSNEIAQPADRGDTRHYADKIEKTLNAFDIQAKVRAVNPGPAVTQYALEVASGIKLSRVTALADDLALALAAPTGQVRIEAPIPGHSLVGVEVPNRRPEVVSLRKMLAQAEMQKMKSKLAVPLGLDVSGKPWFMDIGRMPHVLVAGQTGSGKSVLLNAWIASLLFRSSPNEVRLILVDPKRVEMSYYQGIPHLLAPVIHQTTEVLSALKWAIHQMEERYRAFQEIGVRDIAAYNELAGMQRLPYIVIFIDELADIMISAPAEVEDAIARLAQMARATGIHLVLATQRPTVNIITGLIKANIPARIAFAVPDITNSRVILDAPGAEKLLGRGDMLCLLPDRSRPIRLQGPLITDREIKTLVHFLRQQGEENYVESVLGQPVPAAGGSKRVIINGQERDELFVAAAKLILELHEASITLLQRHLHIGFGRAGRIMDELAAAGIVGPKRGTQPREILVDKLPPDLAS